MNNLSILYIPRGDIMLYNSGIGNSVNASVSSTLSLVESSMFTSVLICILSSGFSRVALFVSNLVLDNPVYLYHPCGLGQKDFPQEKLE